MTGKELVHHKQATGRSLRSAAWVIAIWGLLAAAQYGSAQTSKGIVTGLVRDSSGAVIANADVTVTNEATNETRTVTTTSAGTYRVEGINPGPYQVHVASGGFTTVSVQHLKCGAFCSHQLRCHTDRWKVRSERNG